MAEETFGDDRVLGCVTVLVGARGGKYPHGNSVFVRGSEESIVIDPSLSLTIGRPRPGPVDWVLNSHCHEDHVSGNHLWRSVPWRLHEADLVGIRSLDGMLAIYGYDAAATDYFRKRLVETFRYEPRPDPTPFRAADSFDLGGGVRVQVVHTPGHTRGHSCFYVEPDDVLYLGDIDLSSFGPYYGDAWSSLEDFERSLALVREIEARWYATFHHVGVLEGRADFLARLDRFIAVIQSREERLLAFLDEPRTIDEIAAHRFVYRAGDPVAYADAVERRSMGLHLERLAAAARVREVEPGRWLAG